jgi:hypothetical protein
MTYLDDIKKFRQIVEDGNNENKPHNYFLRSDGFFDYFSNIFGVHMIVDILNDLN